LAAFAAPQIAAAQAFTANVSVTTSDTPLVKLDQTNTGGFTPQVWDIAGNEANFFIRDVTGGNRLPLRIRPGAPTSSIDIAASGNVGVGLAAPTQKLHIQNNVNANSFLLMENSNAGTTAAAVIRTQSNGATLNFQAHATARTISRFGQTLGGWNEMLAVTGNGFAIGTLTDVPLVLGANNQMRLRATNAGVEVFGTFTNSSSRDYKEDIRTLEATEAVEALAGLQPVKFRYKAQKKQNLGFIAEEVPDLVAMDGRKSIAPMDIIALLTKVVQEQQKTIDALGAKVALLEQGR
jgi:hypothetical protein